MENEQLTDACYQPATTSKATKPRRTARRPYTKHGLSMLKRAVSKLGGRAIDKRTTLGRSLARWRMDLIRDIGGPEAVSTQQIAVVDLAVKSKLLLDSIDAWLLTQPTLVNARKRSLLPVVRERQALADALSRYLGQLGLERKAADVTRDLGANPAKYQWPSNGPSDETNERNEESPADGH